MSINNSMQRMKDLGERVVDAGIHISRAVKEAVPSPIEDIAEMGSELVVEPALDVVESIFDIFGL